MSEDINNLLTHAIEATNYNESIQLKMNNNESEEENNNDILLMPMLDKSNGGLTWNNVLSSSSASPSTSRSKKEIILSCHFRTKPWILPMLNDTNRNKVYEQSIAYACDTIVQSKKKGFNNITNDMKCNNKVQVIRVLDIGSGTGLLAMLSASYLLKYQKEEKQLDFSFSFEVISLEMSDAMVELADEIIKCNNLDKYITILNQHSTEYNYPGKSDEGDNGIDLITCELLDTTVLGEGIVPCFRDVWSRLLPAISSSSNPPIVLPQSLKVYGMILSGEKSIACYASNVFGTCRRVPVRAPTFLLQEDIIQLSDVIQLLELDFTSSTNMSSNASTVIQSSFPCKNNGIAHGLLFWFEFDSFDKKFQYNSWDEINTQDHWRHCLYILDNENNTQPTCCHKDQEYIVSTHVNDESLSFTLQQQEQMYSSNTDIIISPQRIQQLNDSSYLSTLYNGITSTQEQYLQYHKKAKTNTTTTIVDLSDYGLCAMLASKIFSGSSDSNTTTTIHSIQTKPYTIHIPPSVHIHHMYPEQLDSTQHLFGKSIDVLVNEPYCSKLEGWDILQAFHLYYTIRGLVNKDTNNQSTTSTSVSILSPNAIVFPQMACIMACVIQFDLFSKAYKSNLTILGSDIVRLDHTSVNQYTSNHKNDILLPLLQYDYKLLTRSFCVHTLQYQQLCTDCTTSASSGWVQVPFIQEGVCHALLSWVEYKSNHSSNTNTATTTSWSTFDKHHVQSIRMLPSSTVATIQKDDIKNKQFRCRMVLNSEVSSDVEGREYDYEFNII